MEIINNLYLGNQIDSQKYYDLIINCSKDLQFYNQTNNIRIPINDDGNIDNYYILDKYIYNIIHKIDENLYANKKVLIHCKNGQQRSATVIACYLMYKYKWSLEYTIKYIKNIKKDAFFWKINFYEYLVKFL